MNGPKTLPLQVTFRDAILAVLQDGGKTRAEILAYFKGDNDVFYAGQEIDAMVHRREIRCDRWTERYHTGTPSRC